MEKKKNSVLKKVVACASIVLLIVSLFCTVCSASDVNVSNNEYDIVSSRIPLLAIEYYQQADLISDGIHADVVVNNPFVFYDYNYRRGGKLGAVVNFPYQDDYFTNSGRTCYYSFIQDGDVFTVQSPIEYLDNSTSRVFANSFMTKYCFGDFVIKENSEDSFYIDHGIYYDVGSVDVYSRYFLTFNVLTYDPDLNIYFEDYHEVVFNRVGDNIGDGILINYDLFSSYVPSGEDVFIKDLSVNYYPFIDSYSDTILSPSVQLTVVDESFVFNADDLNYSENNIMMWFYDHPVIEEVFVGLGDVSLTGWLETAISGFFDFEIVPNLSLGGILYICMGVGIFMLLIRIFKG